jgi:hypothetical protein
VSKLLEFPDIKQPWEEYFLGFDFSSLLGDAIDISTAAVSAILINTGEDKTSDLINPTKQTIANGIVYFWIKACDVGRYKITCKITTTDQSKYEIDSVLKVVEL